MRKNFDEIIKRYNGKNLDEVNAALEAAGASFRLDPHKNEITPEEAAACDEKNGYGMLDTGIGSPDKVEIKNGKLVYNIGDIVAYVDFNGKKYKVSSDGETLVLV